MGKFLINNQMQFLSRYNHLISIFYLLNVLLHFVVTLLMLKKAQTV